jgi:Brp/Blh family beta-carotene 15,15'-monooxygenase
MLYASLGGSFHFVFECVLALVLIGFVGISHGAVDHILAAEVLKLLPNKKLYLFLIGYLSIVALYIAAWFVSPFLSFVLFLLYSAYHFGQADTEIITRDLSSKFILLVRYNYGLIIISALMISNTAYLQTIFPDWFNQSIHLADTIKYSYYVFYSAIALQVVLSIVMIAKNLVELTKLLVFSAQLILILFVFNVLPPLIAFSIYFGLWHALLILQKEYQAFATVKLISSVRAFVALLAPFTLLSILGIAAVIYFSGANANIAVLVAISALAFPHTLLMDKMYSQKTG